MRDVSLAEIKNKFIEFLEADVDICEYEIPEEIKYSEIEDQYISGCKAVKQTCDFIMSVWKSKEDEKRLHGKFSKTRWEKDGDRFDLVRDGLKYHTEVVKPETNNMGGL